MADEMLDIRQHIRLDMVTSGEETLGWIHSHGMGQFGLPELEMKHVPLFLMAPAAELLNHIAQCVYDAKDSDHPILLGHNFATDRYTVVRFVKAKPIPGDEAHYAYEVWEVVADMGYYAKVCGPCNSTHAN